MTGEVRPEAPADHTGVHELNVAAFGGTVEARLVGMLRDQARPVVSLVAEEDAALAGHIMFTPVSLQGFERLMMGLAPMAVAPARQRRGIGSALVRAGLERCKELGAAAVVVLGHPDFYPRFGFVPAERYGLKCEYDAPPEAFMVMELQRHGLRGAGGIVAYHAAFASI
jgi:putative acetyltransferase